MASRAKNLSGPNSVTTVKDQTTALQRARCNYQRLEERYQDLEREHLALKSEYNELRLDYAHAMAQVWTLNAMQARS